MADLRVLGLAALAVWAYVVVRLLPRLRPLTSAKPGVVSALPLYLIIVPLAVSLIQLALAEPITEFSRSRAIRNSAPLIDDIERYRAANGRYPRSLVSVEGLLAVGHRYQGVSLRIERRRLQPVVRAVHVPARHSGKLLCTTRVTSRHDKPRHGSATADTGATGSGAPAGALCRSRRATSALEVLLVRLTDRSILVLHNDRGERRGLPSNVAPPTWPLLQRTPNSPMQLTAQRSFSGTCSSPRRAGSSAWGGETPIDDSPGGSSHAKK
jgi:hypothetical protein